MGYNMNPIKNGSSEWMTHDDNPKWRAYFSGWLKAPTSGGYIGIFMDIDGFKLIRADSSSCWVALEGSYLVNITLVIVSPQGVSGITGLWPHKHSETLATKSLSHWLPRFRSYSEYLPLIVGRTTPELCWFSPWSCWRSPMILQVFPGKRFCLRRRLWLC